MTCVTGVSADEPSVTEVDVSAIVTVPVGATLPVAALTRAVKVTDWVKELGFGADETVVVESAGLMPSVRPGDVEAPKLSEAANSAVSMCEPSASDETDSVAMPDPLSVAPPSDVEPSKKVTVPLGVPEPELTVAKSETLWPSLAEPDGEDVNTVVVGIKSTTCVSVDEVEPVKLALPEYTALRWRDPTGRPLVESDATPEPFGVAVPSDAAPSKNSTSPTGVPVAGETAVTVAVRVTDWPGTLGLVLDTIAVVVAP